MWGSLCKLGQLPDDTLIYCGHDYTVENYEFALTIEPGNEEIRKRLREVKQAEITVPSRMSLEKRLNPFLRADSGEEFGRLRRDKDRFR